MNTNSPSLFAWTSFYTEFANKLLQLKNKRPELLAIIKDTFEKLALKYPFIEHGVPMDDICPFTVFGCFNKGITNENRTAIMKAIGEHLGVQAPVPKEFDGVPVLNNMKTWFFGYKADRHPSDIGNLWHMFETGIHFADNPSDATKNDFINWYDKVSKQKGIKWNLTVGLYWIRPNSYLNLDEKNRTYLLNSDNKLSPDISSISNLKQLPDAKTYLQLIDKCQDAFQKKDCCIHSFPELSYTAWTSSKFLESNSGDTSKNKVSKANFLKWFEPLCIFRPDSVRPFRSIPTDCSGVIQSHESGAIQSGYSGPIQAYYSGLI